MAAVTTMTDGQLVEYWRTKRGLTQEQLAELVTKELRRADRNHRGITRNAVAMWEQDRNGMTEKNRRAVIAALDLTSVEFYRAEPKVAEAR